MPKRLIRPAIAMLVGAFVAASWGQVEESVVSGNATLPQSNEAQLLSGQIQQAIQSGDYAVAFELMTRLPASGDELIVAPGGRTLYPAWRERVRLQELLPPDARSSFEDRFGPVMRGRLDRARREHDLEELKRLVIEFRAASLWEAATGELLDRLIDAGRFSAAAHLLTVVRSASTRGRYAVQQVVALAGAGATMAAERKLALLQQSASGEDGPALVASIDTLKRWLAERSQRSQQTGPTAARPVWDLGGAWSVSLEGQGGVAPRARAEDAALQEAIDRLRRMPQLQVSLSPTDLIFRCRGAVYAFDPLPLTLRWFTLEALPLGSANSSDDDNEVEGGVSEDAWGLLTNALRHVCAVADGRIFTVERVDGRERQPERFGWQPGMSGASPNLLVARSVADGRVLWIVGDDARKPLFSVSFLDGACVVGDTVYAAFEQREGAWVAAIDARSGRVLRERQVIGPPTHFYRTGGACQIVSDGGTLFVSTGNGVVAALELPSLTWLWASTYPSNLAALRGRRWWDRTRVTPPPFGFDGPVLAEDLLLATPADANVILAYDRFDGRQRWPALPRAVYRAVVGATRAGIVLLGTSLVCVDPEDGQTIRWRSAPLETQGKPLIGDDGHVYVAVGGGIVVIDGTTGKLRSAPAALTSISLPARRDTVGEEPAFQGVVLAQDATAVYAVSPNGVTKFPRVEGLRAAIEERRSAQPDDGSAALAAAWADLAAGRVVEMIERAEQLSPAGAEQAVSRERLLIHGFLSLARSATDPKVRLEWLRRAAPLTASPQTRARLALAIGDALEAAGEIGAACEHALEIIGTGGPFLLPVVDDPERSTAPALAGADLLRRLLDRLPADEAQPRIAAAVEKSRSDWRALARLYVALPASHRSEVEGALLTSGAPYEWIETHLSLAPTRDAVADLERFATAVAIGDLERARTLADALQLGGAENPASLAPDAGEPEWRRGLIRHYYEKLQSAVEPSPAFDAFMVRWRLVDQRAVVSVDGTVPWPIGLVYAPIDGQRELRWIDWRGGTTWRKTSADLKYEDADRALADAARRLQRGEDAQEMLGQIGVVSLLHRHRALAVVPTPRGLIAAGLAGFGEESRAGTRIWDLDLAAEISDDSGASWFGESSKSTIAAGSAGVAVLRGDGHVRVLDWADGAPRWDRQIAAWEPERIFFCGERLVVIGAGGEALILDGRDGTIDPRGLPEGTRLREPIAVGDRLWMRTDNEAGVWDFSRGEALWRAAFAPQEMFIVDAEGGIAAVNRLDDRGWSAIELDSGREIALTGLGSGADVLAIARREDAIFVIETRPEAPLPTIAYRRYDAAGGEPRWTREVQTRFIPSPHHLVGNPAVIPVVNQPGESDGDAGISNWTLQFIDKATGKVSPPEPLAVETLSPDEGIPEVQLLAGPTRILVQLGSRLTAWGALGWGDSK